MIPGLGEPTNVVVFRIEQEDMVVHICAPPSDAGKTCDIIAKAVGLSLNSTATALRLVNSSTMKARH
jgi:hypothetical protein